MRRAGTTLARRVARTAAVALLAAAPSDAQTYALLVRVGDVVPGVGAVTDVRRVAVNDHGDWRVEVDTDGASGGDELLLGPAGVALGEGQAMAGGGTLADFESFALGADGRLAHLVRLAGVPPATDHGVFLDASLLLRRGDPVGASGVPPGTVYASLDRTWATEGAVLCAAVLDGPGLASPLDALVRLEHDGVALVAEELLVLEGVVPPGEVDAYRSVSSTPTQNAINASGETLSLVRFTGSTSADYAVRLDGQTLAREGGPGPVPGVTWSVLAGTSLDLNDRGAWLAKGRTTGSSVTNEYLVQEGQVLVRKGDVLPAFAPATLVEFGAAPVRLANNGIAHWWGRWSAASPAPDHGLFADGELLVRNNGAQSIGGFPVDVVSDALEAFDVSPSGRFVLFQGILGGAEAACLVDRGGMTLFPGCSTPPGSLAHVAGVPRAGDSVEVEFGDGPGSTAVPILVISTEPFAPQPACGFPVAFGEVMVGLAPPNPITFVPAPSWSPGAPSVLTFDITGPMPPPGADFVVQGAFLRAGPPLQIDLTNALYVVIGS